MYALPLIGLLIGLGLLLYGVGYATAYSDGLIHPAPRYGQKGYRRPSNLYI